LNQIDNENNNFIHLNNTGNKNSNIDLNDNSNKVDKINNRNINIANNIDNGNSFILDSTENINIGKSTKDTMHNAFENRYNKIKSILDNSYTYNNNKKNRFDRLKSILYTSINSYTYNNNNNKNRFDRLKIMLYNSINSDISIKSNKNNDDDSKTDKDTFEPIEEFIKKYEKSKMDKQVKNNVLDEKYDIIYVETEYDLICEFFNQIRQLDPDLIIGYNTFGFDYKYLAQRAGMYLVIDQKDSPFKASRILDKPTKFISDKINNEVELKIPGRMAIDMFKYAKSLNMPSASLNYVSEQLLNKHKIDLPYKDMFYLIYENTNDSLNKVAIYCIMDSILTLEIFNISHQWIQLLEVAKISRIRIDEIYKNGQSKKFAN